MYSVADAPNRDFYLFMLRYIDVGFSLEDRRDLINDTVLAGYAPEFTEPEQEAKEA